MHFQPQSESVATRIALHPFLAGMTRTQLALLTDCAIATHFKKDQTILREKEMANRFYLLETGKVVVEARATCPAPVLIEKLGPGDLLGWSWMFPPYVWHFSARAVEPTDALFFCGSILREYCERDHSLGFELFKRMSAVMVHRLHLAQQKILAMHARTPEDAPTCEPRPVLQISA
jgi:CRP/FNR family cyclic AMP-dependent transcriptional regulator